MSLETNPGARVSPLPEMQAKSLTPGEAAILIGVSEQTLAVWRSQKRGPNYCKPAKKVFYPKADLEQWLASKVKVTNANTRTRRTLALPGVGAGPRILRFNGPRGHKTKRESSQG